MSNFKLVFLIGPSPFGEKETEQKPKLVVLPMEELPEQECGVVNRFFPAPLPPYQNVSSQERIAAINDILTGSGFFQNFYCADYVGFPFNPSGRLIGIKYGVNTMWINDLFAEIAARQEI